MTETVSATVAEPNLRARGPAYAVMQECLRVQQDAKPGGRVARFFGGSPLHPDARSWYRGALGEIEVAGVLSRLGSEWTVLHAVPVGAGSSDIDHVIVGPAGLFTINTKNHAGKKIFVAGSTFIVNGFKQEYMRNSRHEAERASKLLSTVTGRPVTVTPLIVVVHPLSILTGRKRPTVKVLASQHLRRWLLRRPRVLSERAVKHFSMFAEERSTWRATPLANDDTEPYVQRFEGLRNQVEAARKRARLWSLFMLVGCSCALVALMLALFEVLVNAAHLAG
ncbi:nuclease-related domain-containing protein [Glaciihabitans sp. UYNi722]|uniref:nuclease-related domain-containing protein n=1 Tax=Glaciihabitans sp. UYNi722 TaxID=3156344 RepID=UPI003398902F